MYGRHLLSINDVTKEEIERILTVAQRLEKTPQPTLLQGKLVAHCFFEPSTRTSLSFQAATLRLGGSVFGVC